MVVVCVCVKLLCDGVNSCSSMTLELKTYRMVGRCGCVLKVEYFSVLHGGAVDGGLVQTNDRQIEIIKRSLTHTHALWHTNIKKDG